MGRNVATKDAEKAKSNGISATLDYVKKIKTKKT